MPKWPVTVAFTDDEAEALEALAAGEFDGDRDAAMEALLASWLEGTGRRSDRFRV